MADAARHRGPNLRGLGAALPPSSVEPHQQGWKRKIGDEDMVCSSKVRRSGGSASNLCGNIITLEVGDGKQKQSFAIHKDVLMKHSSYFQTMLGKDWKEGKTREVPMPEGDAEAFELFLRFAYTAKVFSETWTIPRHLMTRAVEKEQNANEVERLARAWALGEKLLSTTFKDAVADATVDKINSRQPRKDPEGSGGNDLQGPRRKSLSREGVYLGGNLPQTMHAIIWAWTTDGPRGMKRLLVDVAACSWSVDVMRSAIDGGEMPQEFLREVRLMEKQETARDAPDGSILRSRMGCEYHEHAAGVECCRGMFK